jgi:hypothetical protein
LNISDIPDKDVFMGCTFYSLVAFQGGAIFTYSNISIKNCRFANNTAENDAGNDIYVSMTDSSYFSDSSNVMSSCSLSLAPGLLVTSGGVYFVFIGLIIFI